MIPRSVPLSATCVVPSGSVAFTHISTFVTSAGTLSNVHVEAFAIVVLVAHATLPDQFSRVVLVADMPGAPCFDFDRLKRLVHTTLPPTVTSISTQPLSTVMLLTDTFLVVLLNEEVTSEEDVRFLDMENSPVATSVIPLNSLTVVSAPE